MKILVDASPNFSRKTRLNRDIEFVIIHYTGMQSEIVSLKKLKNNKSKVSCHYLINRKGTVFQLVKDHKIAWHAGKSKWKNCDNLNKNSIGIELVNKGHDFGYQNFSKPQIKNLISLCKILKKKYIIKKENFLGHSDIAPKRKIDPGEKFPWKKLSKYHLGIWYENTKNDKLNFIGRKKIRNLFMKNLHKIGYRYFTLNKKSNSEKLIVKAFQRKYLPQKITGKIDKKMLQISHFLASKY